MFTQCVVFTECVAVFTECVAVFTVWVCVVVFTECVVFTQCVAVFTECGCVLQPLSGEATAAEVQSWLVFHRFSNYTRIFQHFSGKHCPLMPAIQQPRQCQTRMSPVKRPTQ